MNLHSLKPADKSVRKNKRLGRGQGSGGGGTATRGHKGAQSRSGYSAKAGFEGGQMPIQRRLPKFGFNNPNKVVFKVLNLDDLTRLVEEYSATEINPEFLKKHGFMSKKDVLKVLGRGEISAAVTVSAHAMSASAKEKIEKAGGSFTAI